MANVVEDRQAKSGRDERLIFATFSGPGLFATAAFLVGGAALVLTGLLLSLALLGRLLHYLQRSRRQRVLDRWRPLLMASLYELPESLPSLSRFDYPDFLDLWNHLHESLGSEARGNLERVAGLARVPAAVSRMLRRGGYEGRLAALRTAGNLRLSAIWDVLRELLESDSVELSLAAAQALSRIDATRAVPLLMPPLLMRDDWPPQRIVTILRELESERLACSLLKAIEETVAEKAEKLLHYLVEVAPLEAAPVIRRQIANPSDERLLIACLKVLNDFRELEILRSFCSHQNWLVRLHAASAFGRLGVHDDKAILAGMLGDCQWWVRYRAARALAQLPGMTSGELLRIKDMQTDRYARDMLHQVMAELDLAADWEALPHG